MSEVVTTAVVMETREPVVVKQAPTASAWPLVLRFPASEPLTDELLLQISGLNDGWRFERNANGDLEIMSPSSYSSSMVAAELVGQLRAWIRAGIGGLLLGADSGFRQPSNSVRGPDAAWLSRERLGSLTAEQRAQAFLPICPDFLVEVRSPGDRLSLQQDKMVDWMAGGTLLGWLIDPESETVHIYRSDGSVSDGSVSDGSVEIVERPDALSAEPTCPGLTISFEYVWNLQSQVDVESDEDV